MQRLATSAVALATTLLTASLATAQWEQQSPTTSPTARRGAAMTFAPNAGGVLLFGGTGGASPSSQTWLYDGTDWTLLAPATNPGGRQETEMVYDVVRGRVVQFGGVASAISAAPPSNQTWEYDGVTWAQAVTATNPGNRYRHAMSHDIQRGRTVVYGGATSTLLGSLTNQTWEYDGLNWTQVVTAANPGALDRPAMCYHAGIGKTVLFGGADNGGTLFDRTWTYDGVNWTQLTIPGAKPAARNGAKMVYDDVRGVCVLTGGQDASVVAYADTWEFDGVGWTQQPTTTQPARDHSLAFFPGKRQVVRFGGFAAAPNVLSNQTWEFGARWNSFGVGCAGSNGVPALVMPDAGRLGGSYTLDLSNLNTSPLLAVMVLGLLEIPGGVPLDFLGMTGCLGFVSPDVLVNVPTAGGIATYTWNPVVGTVGDRIYAQALCLDPGANPGWLTASNAVATTLGF